jgi:hypothetical protein
MELEVKLESTSTLPLVVQCCSLAAILNFCKAVMQGRRRPMLCSSDDLGRGLNISTKVRLEKHW